MLIRRPKGIFLKMFELLRTPNFSVSGLVCLMFGLSLVVWRELGWTLEVANFFLSIGLGIVFCAYLGRSVGESRKRAIIFVVLAMGCFALFVSQQGAARRVVGTVLFNGQPVETVNIQRGGVLVEHHLGAPLQLSGTASDKKGLSTLSYGLQTEGVLEETWDNSKARYEIGPWTLESLGVEYQTGDLVVTLSVELEPKVWTPVSLQPGGVATISEQTTLRLASLKSMGQGEGYRMIVEMLHNGKRDYRMLYDQTPNLEEHLQTESPRLRVLGIEHRPAKRFLLYSSAWMAPLWGFGLLAALMVGVGFFLRERE